MKKVEKDLKKMEGKVEKTLNKGIKKMKEI